LAYRQDGDFRPWAEQNKGASLRRFQIVYDTTEPAGVSNVTEEMRWVTMVIRVAYPNDFGGRFGSENDRSRDDVMAEDQHSIEGAVGLRGYSNLAGVACFNKTGSGPPEKEPGDSVEFLTFRNLYLFTRSFS